jgi:hypothetical protein
MILTVAELRAALGLPTVRPDGVRDLLAVACEEGTPVPAADSWRLALDDWPEVWSAAPSAAPRFLVMLDGPFIATVETIDVSLWGTDGNASPQRRVVPVTGTACQVTAVVGGAQVSHETGFGWPCPEERYAFW